MTSTLKIAAIAPDFRLPADGDSIIALSSFRGRKVVLYFYPKDDTSGCTLEAKDFSTLKQQFDAADTIILGMSPDQPSRHDKFKKKYELELSLVSDTEKTTLNAYGVWVQKSMYGRKYMGVERTTVLIDRDGRITRIWNKVKVPGHAAEVLAAAQALD